MAIIHNVFSVNYYTNRELPFQDTHRYQLALLTNTSGGTINISSSQLNGKFIEGVYYRTVTHLFGNNYYYRQQLYVPADTIIEDTTLELESVFVYGSTTSKKTATIRFRNIGPIIATVADQTWTEGSTVDLDIAISRNPTTITVEGLMVGLGWRRTKTGIKISGTVANSTYGTTTGTVTIKATNSGGTHIRTFNFTGVS